MLENIRNGLRLKHKGLDTEISMYIHACKKDLSLAGVEYVENDELIGTAVLYYCRWQYDFEGKGDKYRDYYNKLKDGLSLSSKYRECGGQYKE